MPRGKKWTNEAMWQQVAEWHAGGLTYSEICGRLSRPENRRRFGLEVVPLEDALRRGVKTRQASMSPPSGERLQISDPITGWWKHDFENELYYVTLAVRALAAEVRDCCACLEIRERPGLVFALHWAEDRYDIAEMKPQYRNISIPSPARLDVAFVPAVSSAEMEPATIRSPSLESLGTYGSFTYGGLQGWGGRGCWVARPLDLSGPSPGSLAYLTPGEYRVCLRIYSQRDFLLFQSEYLLTSPERPEELRLEKIASP